MAEQTQVTTSTVTQDREKLASDLESIVQFYDEREGFKAAIGADDRDAIEQAAKALRALSLREGPTATALAVQLVETAKALIPNEPGTIGGKWHERAATIADDVARINLSSSLNRVSIADETRLRCRVCGGPSMFTDTDGKGAPCSFECVEALAALSSTPPTIADTADWHKACDDDVPYCTMNCSGVPNHEKAPL